jgi:hypothetical protein
MSLQYQINFLNNIVIKYFFPPLPPPLGGWLDAYLLPPLPLGGGLGWGLVYRLTFKWDLCIRTKAKTALIEVKNLSYHIIWQDLIAKQKDLVSP